MSPAARRRSTAVEVEDPGAPQLEDLDQDQVAGEPGDAGEQPGPEPIEPELLPEGWDPARLEAMLSGLWNTQCAWYGVKYAARPGELAPMAVQLKPLADRYLPAQAEGAVGGLAMAGVTIGTLMAMHNDAERAELRQAPAGPFAKWRRGQGGQQERPRPAREAGPETSQPAPAASNGKPKDKWTAAEMAALQAAAAAREPDGIGRDLGMEDM